MSIHDPVLDRPVEALPPSLLLAWFLSGVAFVGVGTWFLSDSVAAFPL